MATKKRGAKLLEKVALKPRNQHVGKKLAREAKARATPKPRPIAAKGLKARREDPRAYRAEPWARESLTSACTPKTHGAQVLG
jgi:hypothetical protein